MRVEQSRFGLDKLDTVISKNQVPIKTFKELSKAIVNMDFSNMNDASIKSKYYDSKQKILTYMMKDVYQNVYKNETYDKFIHSLLELYTVIDVLVETRKHITDLSRQPIEIVQDFLDSWGAPLYYIYDEKATVEIARHIYFFLRRKGTTAIMVNFLHKLGIHHFLINEFVMTKKDDEWKFCPAPVYKSEQLNIMKERNLEFLVDENDDALWYLFSEDLNEIYPNTV